MLGMRLNSSYQGSYKFSSENGHGLTCHVNLLSEARVKHSLSYKPNILHQVGTTIVTEQLLLMKGKPKENWFGITSSISPELCPLHWVTSSAKAS